MAIQILEISLLINRTHAYGSRFLFGERGVTVAS